MLPCLVDLEWCVALCTLPPAVCLYKPEDNGWALFDNSCDGRLAGQTCQGTCKLGWVQSPTGPPTVTCGDDGLWGSTITNKCTKAGEDAVSVELLHSLPSGVRFTLTISHQTVIYQTGTCKPQQQNVTLVVAALPP